jgi:membrane protease YdiL (CAAX protease family)
MAVIQVSRNRLDVSTTGRIVLMAAVAAYGLLVMHIALPFRFSLTSLGGGLAAGMALSIGFNHRLLRARRPIAATRFAALGAYLALVSVLEELFYRGVFFAMLSALEPAFVAAALVTGLFAASHQEQGWKGVALHVATGIVFLALLLLTGTLLAPLAAHVAYNATIIALSRQPKGMS